MNRLVAVIMLTMTGFCLASEEISPGLEATDWRLSSYLGLSGDMQSVPAGINANARLIAGKVTGKAGCNNYFGEYSLGPGGLLVFPGKLGATMMACPPPISDLEQRYLGLLPEVTAYRLQDRSLSMLDKEGHILLEFVARKPVSLENTAWQAGGINNGRGGVVSSGTTALANALFSDGKVTGSAGCNRFTAAYRTSDNQITIEQTSTTRMYCGEPEGIMDQEQQYLAALSRARTFTIKFDRLELRDGAGALQLSFTVAQ